MISRREIRSIGPTSRPQLDDLDGADDLLDECGADVPPEEVRNAMIVEYCLSEEGALFESGLPELLAWLRKQQNGEAVADVLGSLVSGGPGIEPWFGSEFGLVGLLNVEETSELARALGKFRKGFSPPRRPKGLAALSRHFRTSGPAIEHLEELFEVIDDCAAEMLGLAAVRVS